jgi:hypothetical protein
VFDLGGRRNGSLEGIGRVICEKIEQSLVK